ncbi:MAG: hypothetical protein K0U66_09380 [Gammaproteobacteria bacterium]|nr:hypothetical protein [Gammaproteobacteria bacterium]
MSTGTGGDQNTQGSGFDFRTLVSLAALVASGAAIYYAVTVDASDKVADLEGSLKSLNAKVNELPTSDGVKQLIGDTVVIPPQGPSSDNIQAMIDKSTMKTEQVQNLIDQSKMTAVQVQGLIDKSARSDADVIALVEANTLNVEAVQTMIDKSAMTKDDIQVQIDSSVLSADDVQNLITTSLTEVRSTVAGLPDEARVNALAQEATANTVPKGAVVAFATSCPAEFGWKEYAAARGRFVVAVGQNTDLAGTSRAFTLGIGDNDGAYQHVLTVDEMPAHRHAVERQGPTRGIEGLPPIGTDGAIIATIEQEMTSTAGKGQAHNNVPPYIALHFCEKT